MKTINDKISLLISKRTDVKMSPKEQSLRPPVQGIKK